MIQQRKWGPGFLLVLAALITVLIAFACGGSKSSSSAAVDDDASDDDAVDDDVSPDDDDNDATDDDDDDSADDDNDTAPVDDDDNDDGTPTNHQLLSNGSFQNGDATPWVGEWPYNNIVGTDEPPAADDDTWTVPDQDNDHYAAWFGQVQIGNDTSWLGQTVHIPENATGAGVNFWMQLYHMGGATMTFTARVVDPLNPATVYADLGTWTQNSSWPLLQYKQEQHTMTADEFSKIVGKNVMLRYDYTGHHPILTAAYVYLDNVSFVAAW